MIVLLEEFTERLYPLVERIGRVQRRPLAVGFQQDVHIDEAFEMITGGVLRDKRFIRDGGGGLGLGDRFGH
uniref:hypothetical protein n=1 Tax=Halococcus agarilyticus TaxID=1232219 RepID=UPI000677639D|nr:hypothetical protein [Halococcus agarilyticus]